MIRDGVPVEFIRDKPPPPFELPQLPVSAEQRKWWFSVEEPRLLELGAISRVEGQCPAHVCNAFCVPKPGGRNWRVVVNLKRMNVAQRGHKCRYETLKVLRHMGIKGSWMVKADLADAYYHFPVRACDRKYFSFRFCDQLYVMNVLPFGWLNSPYYFTKIMRNVVRFWREPRVVLAKKHRLPPPAPPNELYPRGGRTGSVCPGVRVLPYLDDFLFVFASREQAVAGAAWIKEVISFLGLSWHPTKCVWDPVQSVQHLGLTINSMNGLFEVPKEKLAKLRRLAVGLRVTAKKNKRLVSKRDLAQLCGFAQSVKLALVPAQLFLRNLYEDLAQPVGWSGKVQLSRRSMRDLDWWCDIPQKHCSAPIHVGPAAVHLSVDASGHSWGAVLQGRQAHGAWSASELPEHINWKELRAVRMALLSFLPLVQGRVVCIREDNTGTQAVLGKGASRSKPLHNEYRLLWEFLQEHAIVLEVERVASADNEADEPSRLVDTSVYQLHPDWFRLLEQRYGPHDVDLFASHTNTHLPRFFSRFHCPGTAGVDSLQQPWAGLNAYGHPPITPDFLLSVVQKVREERATVTLVVPYWTAQPWWQLLMELASDVLFLPSSTGLFTPAGKGPGRFPRPPVWRVVAVRVTW